MRLGVCMKWVDTRPAIDPLSGEVGEDLRWFAASRADQAALETALAIGAASSGDAAGEVVVICAGPPESESMLRDALAAGANRAVRVEIDPGLDSAEIAAAVAPVLANSDLVVCGDWSIDRGTGSFPAFLAHELGAAQALGCTTVKLIDEAVEAERRLDGGRRERVRLHGRGVVSVEAGVELRRAGLKALLAAADATIEVVAAPAGSPPRHRAVASGPFRPRSREMSAPTDDEPRVRLMTIAGALLDHEASQAVRLDPDAAADLLLDRLAVWGVGPDDDDSGIEH